MSVYLVWIHCTALAGQAKYGILGKIEAMKKGKKISLVSRHDQIMKEFTKEGKVHIFSDKENDQIIRGLNQGSAEFEMQCRINQAESERELHTIILNA